MGTESETGSKTVTAATTFSEMQEVVEDVLTALGENCVNANCSYTALLKSSVNNAMGRYRLHNNRFYILSQKLAGVVWRQQPPRVHENERRCRPSLDRLRILSASKKDLHCAVNHSISSADFIPN